MEGREREKERKRIKERGRKEGLIERKREELEKKEGKGGG